MSSEEVDQVFSLIRKRINELVENGTITEDEGNRVKLIADQNFNGTFIPLTLPGTASDAVIVEIQKVYKDYLGKL